MGSSKRVEEMNYFELIAWLGIGSSHPGGFPATRQNLLSLQLKAEDYVLDAGCGSGLTACHTAKIVGCKIVGIDVNPIMIEKAKKRAEKEGVSHLVTFEIADVYHLPYQDNSFDVIMAESITVFLKKAEVYQELYRVLKPHGRVADLEMILIKELPLPIRKQMEDCFGSSTNPLLYEEWINTLADAGFEEVCIENPQPMRSNSNTILSELKKDWLLLKDLPLKIKNQPGLYKRLQRNANFMKKNLYYFGFGLITGRKPEPKPKPSLKEGIRQWFLRLFHKRC
ncbi:demethylrebeccamycin-D-glucose O-methyltransferase [Desulfosporosinus acididurans]|uniref:Demethylrebeccamycin-D-glucose O-methyltransferase n=1 Tax=Desulfosporosinus acididurans TaxID=476652 RepID=A0A0J1FL47_9FIRM|nr:demethylrebeccamycin-D-glucose O-methyltransferase [Desulfosporosinus acididurans]